MSEFFDRLLDRFVEWLIKVSMRVLAWYVWLPAGRESEA